MASKLGEIIVSAIVPIITSVGKDKLVEVLQKLKNDNEAAYKTVLTSLYGPIDVYLEAITDKTKTPIDDSFVDALKQAIEQSAAINGVTLQNLDAD